MLNKELNESMIKQEEEMSAGSSRSKEHILRLTNEIEELAIINTRQAEEIKRITYEKEILEKQYLSLEGKKKDFGED